MRVLKTNLSDVQKRRQLVTKNLCHLCALEAGPHPSHAGHRALETAWAQEPT